MKPRRLASRSNRRLKLARKLGQRRQRAKEGLFVAEGPHVVAAALEAGARLRDVFCTEDMLARHGELAEALEASPWPVWAVDEELMAGAASTEHPQGVVAVVEMPPEPEPPGMAPGLLAVALEGVGDPGNVGSVVRSAHAAGASQVVLGPGCCDAYNAKAVRASAGGVFAVPVVRAEELGGLLRRLRTEGAKVVAAIPGGPRAPWEADLRAPLVVVMGGEARGMSEATAAEAVQTVGIPMPGGAESLNVAAAAAALLYEVTRQTAG